MDFFHTGVSTHTEAVHVHVLVLFSIISRGSQFDVPLQTVLSRAQNAHSLAALLVLDYHFITKVSSHFKHQEKKIKYNPLPSGRPL